MPKRDFRLHDGHMGSAIAVRVTPRASRNKIVEMMADGTIKIHIAAPPVDGEANEALIRFLAEVLNVPKSRLEIVGGLAGLVFGLLFGYVTTLRAGTTFAMISVCAGYGTDGSTIPTIVAGRSPSLMVLPMRLGSLPSAVVQKRWVRTATPAA